MKAIESFGGWVLDTKAGLIFGVVLMLCATATVGWQVWKSPRGVCITEDHFVCADTEPHGIGAECTIYKKIR